LKSGSDPGPEVGRLTDADRDEELVGEESEARIAQRIHPLDDLE